MARKKSVKKEVKEEDDFSDIKPDGYIGDITEAQYWEWRCASAERHLAKEKHDRNLLMHRLLTLEIEKQKSDSKVFALSSLEQSKKEISNADGELSATRKKLSDYIGHPIEGCIINEAFQVLKPESPHGSVSN